VGRTYELLGSLLSDGDTVYAAGAMSVVWMDTPHTPHGWDSGTVFEETTKTLFVGDLFTQHGGGELPPLRPAQPVQSACLNCLTICLHSAG
jgi:hypothetical protein